MSQVDVQELLDSGVHFGHRTSRWNPKMKPYLRGKRNTIHIIDLKATVRGLVRATHFLRAVTGEGYDVLFVLADAVKRCKNPKDPDALAKAIRETKGVACITGNIDLTTEDRTPVKDLVIVKVEGRLKFHATIKAER